jgi:phosphoserine aminotransferase
MPHRVYNFGAGPAMLPLPVMERIRDEFLDYRGMGASVIEISHRLMTTASSSCTAGRACSSPPCR